MAENGSSQQSTSDNTLQSLIATTNPVTGLNDDQIGALQSVLDKYHKQAAQEAFATLGPEGTQKLIDTHNITSSIFGGGGNPSGGASGSWGDNPTSTPDVGTSNNPQQILSSILSDNNSNNAPSVDDQISDINKQAQLNLAKQNLAQSKPPDFLQRFSQQFSKMAGGQTQGETLQNIGAMQKIAGGEPLQPKDIADLNAGTYKAALEASHQSAALEAQKLPALIDLYGKVSEARGVTQKGLGIPSSDQTKTLTNLKTAGENLNTHISNLQTLIQNRPTFTSKGMDNQSQQTVTKIQEGQTATNPKTNQKIVFRSGKWVKQ